MNVMSACGVMCSECPAFFAAAKGVAHQQQTVEAWIRIYDFKETVENMSCGGCLSSDQDVFHTSRRCKARLCCRSKGFNSCAECPVEACPDLERAQAVWDGVPQLAEKLSAEDFARYAQPYCGHRERLAASRHQKK